MSDDTVDVLFAAVGRTQDDMSEDEFTQLWLQSMED